MLKDDPERLLAHRRTRRHHGNRFGRSEEARAAVLEAVDDLLLERGFAALTIEAVAERAGVGKQTIYRWWAAKIDVLFDALIDEINEEMMEIDEGNLRDDLLAHMRQLASFFTSPGNRAMFKALAGHAQHDPEFGARFHSGIVEPQRARDRAPFERAKDRGHLPPNIDVDGLVEELTSPLYYRLLVSDASYSEEDSDAAVKLMLRRRRQ